ncbi:MAG: tRNA lysidine(34) synthetase TilS [Ferruginibacter sp.]|nr:tRNA lysidine(34) synthetase TilS [Ferruginibacter sp.]
MELLEKFTQHIKKENLFQPKDRLLLAVSGGIDSVVLCELCRQAGYDFEMAHCNFQLRGDDSNRDEKFVAALAKKFGVVFYVKTFETIPYAQATKKSVEEAARDLRYQWFYSLIEPKKWDDGQKEMDDITYQVSKQRLSTLNYILTAHHADDNIETVLMNFFRGTGITGLRGILPKQGKLIRPLLFARRTELEIFVKDNALEFVTDHTNFENDYTRNYFRNTIIPLVSESFPRSAKNVLKNIQRFRETEILYQQAVQLHKKKLLEQKGGEIHIPVLKLLKTTPLATVVYEIIKDFGFTSHQTEEAIALLKSETGKYIQSATHRVIKNRNWLVISPIATIECAHVLIEENDHAIVFLNGTISMEKIAKARFSMVNDPLVAQLDPAQIKFPLLLRKWKQGDYFYPLGMQKKKKLSRFFIDQKLSLTQKENTWVIEMDKKIIWVVGKRIDNRYKVTDDTQDVLKIDYLPK